MSRWLSTPDKLPSAVSGGQQQRVAIARALANDPALIVADEPTGSLDSRTADTIFQLFEELVDQGKTILMVTHDSDLASRASRVVLIVDGEVVETYVRSALAGISESDLVDVSARLEPQALEAGATVFAQGDVADSFYIVVRGVLEVVRIRANGIEEVVEILHPGQYFGEIGLLNATHRNASVRVSEDGDASLVALDADTFRRLVADNALANDAIASVMRQRMTADTVRRAMPSAVTEGLANVGDHVQRLTFGPGETIVAAGDPANWFCVVAEGVVEVMTDGGEAVAFKYRKGRHFGTTGLSHGGRSIAMLRAAPDERDGTTIVAIPSEVHKRIVAETGLTNHHVALVLAEADGP